MKYIICTDIHIDRKSGSSKEIKITKNFFDWFLDTAKERDIKKFIFLGDWFNNRKSVSVPSLHESNEIFKKVEQQFDTSYIVVGNHDMFYNDLIEPNGLDVFQSSKIHIIKNLTLLPDTNILLIPWLIDNDDIQKIKDNDTESPIAMGHLGINDVYFNRSEKAKSKNNKLSFSDFDNYKLVLSGHYHQYGEYGNNGNIIYIGSPYHMTFNDSGKRGIYIYDTDTNDIEFIEYTKAPKYHIIDGEDYDSSIIQGNNIRIDFHNDLGLDKFGDIINSINNLEPESINVSYKFTPTFTNEEEDDTIEDVKSNKDMLIDYIKKSKPPKHLSINMFKKLIESLEKD